jgi:hypothetical protein
MPITQATAHCQQLLEVSDRVARAAHLWIRHGFPGAPQELIAGLISGLCAGLELQDSHALMAGYAYALIDGETVNALPHAETVLRCQTDSAPRAAFVEGQQAARELMIQLDPTAFQRSPQGASMSTARN